MGAQCRRAFWVNTKLVWGGGGVLDGTVQRPSGLNASMPWILRMNALAWPAAPLFLTTDARGYTRMGARCARCEPGSAWLCDRRGSCPLPAAESKPSQNNPSGCAGAFFGHPSLFNPYRASSYARVSRLGCPKNSSGSLPRPRDKNYFETASSLIHASRNGPALWMALEALPIMRSKDHVPARRKGRPLQQSASPTRWKAKIV
jgi:hypothetical protein